MPDQQTGELTAQERRACVFRAQGYTKAEAFKAAFPKSRARQKSIIEQASRLFEKPQVQATVRGLLEASKPSDLLSIGAWQLQIMDDTEAARKRGNDNGVMNGNRLLGQALGGLKDNVSLTVEQRASDDDLIKAAAGDNVALAAALRKQLGAVDAFDA